VNDCTVVVPAFNESDSIQHLLAGFARWPRDRIIVVDNNSEDGTSSLAAEFGIVVLHESRCGKGFAVVTGAKWAQTDYLFLCDADIKGIAESSILSLMATIDDRDVLARLSIPRSARVTNFTAKPLLAALGMDSVAEPIGGLALVSRQFLLEQHLPGGWGFDIGVTVSALRASGKIPEVETPGISHRQKATSSLKGMANEVLRAGLQSFGLIPWSHEDCTKCIDRVEGLPRGDRRDRGYGVDIRSRLISEAGQGRINMGQQRRRDLGTRWR